MQDNISNVNIAKRLEHTDMSNCLLNVVAQHLRFYYAVAEFVKNSRDVVFIIFAGSTKSWALVVLDHFDLVSIHDHWKLISHIILSFIHFGYSYGASSSPLLLRGAPDYSIDTALELTCRSTTGNCE